MYCTVALTMLLHSSIKLYNTKKNVVNHVLLHSEISSSLSRRKRLFRFLERRRGFRFYARYMIKLYYITVLYPYIDYIK